MSFTRSHESYMIDQVAVDRILADSSNPLNLIANTIQSRSRVLDIGAGNGVLGMLLSRLSKDVSIDGIEPCAQATDLANGYYQKMIHGTLEDVVFPGSSQDTSLPLHSYDYVVLADVIEHTINPSSTIGLAKQLLAEKGQLLISVPNVCFAPIRAEMLNGDWQYTDWGIIERTHLRFFTKRSLLQTLHDSGLHINEFHHLGRSPFEMEKKLQDYDIDILSLWRMKHDPLALTYQFLALCSCSEDAMNISKECHESWHNIDSTHFIRRYFRLRESLGLK
jgi:2-polyprenyl-3-methyl-5-hydroxy-6-metoxy-1,4-benzoquinol methylase